MSEQPAEPFEPGNAVYSVTLPAFEGPLDLLLHLCQKHELNILDIPIGFVTSKYLEYLSVMTLMNLDIASEYLVMAATLAHIKSKMLLPAPPPGQDDDALLEEEDPREALIRRLLEYQKYKEAAASLGARGVAGRDVFPRGAPVEDAEPQGLAPLAEVPLYALVEAFQRVLDKTKVKIAHDIVPDRLSITERIHELVDILQLRKRMTFEELFDDVKSRSDLVITFLALLEMSKLRITRLFQTEPLAPLYVEATGFDGELPSLAGTERSFSQAAPPPRTAPEAPETSTEADAGEPTEADAGEPTEADAGEPTEADVDAPLSDEPSPEEEDPAH